MTKIMPPHNQDAEQSLLGCIMLGGRALAIASEILTAEDFYQPRHRMIFETAQQLQQHGHSIDLVTMMQGLKERGQLDDAGGASYLATLTSVVPGLTGVTSYARIIKESSTLRKLIAAGHDLVARCGSGDTVEEVVDHISSSLMEITAVSGGSGPEPISSIVGRVMVGIREACDSDDPSGVPTGLPNLDERLFGLQPSDLIVLAARPSMGKTTLALNIASNAAERGYGVLFFSMEMSKEQLVRKVLSDKSGVPLKSLQRGLLNENSWPQVERAAQRLASGRGALLEIDDTPALTVPRLANKAKLKAMDRKLDLVVVDYLQLMRAKANSTEQEIAIISSGLKALAKEMRVPVLVLSQLSRKCEERNDKRPMMSDLRYSGAIEQDADVIGFLYRDDYYHRDDGNPVKGVTELNIAKFRNGEPGLCMLGFNREESRFYAISDREEMR